MKKVVLLLSIVLIVISPILLIAQPQDFMADFGDILIVDQLVNSQNRGFGHNIYFIDFGANTDNTQTLINSSFGSLFHKKELLNLKSINSTFGIFLTYNSNSTFVGRFGRSWQLNLNVRYVKNNYNSDIIVIGDDDKCHYFQKSESAYTSNNTISDLSLSGDSIIFTDYKNRLKTKFIKYYFTSEFHHYPTLIEFENKSKISLSYNFNNELESATLDNGEKILFIYNNNNYLEQIIYNDRRINLTYDFDLLVKIEDNIGNVINYQYDSDCNFLQSIIRPDNSVVSFEFDNGKLAEASIGEDSFQLSYSESITSIKDFYENETYFSFDDNYNTTKVDNSIINTEITRSENEVIIETADDVSKFRYSDNELIDIEKNSKVFRIDRAADNQISKVNGNLDDVYYDNRKIGNDIEIVIDNHKKHRITYTENGKISNWLSPTGLLLNFDYNSESYITSINDTRNSFTFEYDLSGRITQFTDYKNNSYAFDYDKNGNLFLIEYPDNSKEEFNYDEIGNLLEHKDRMGNAFSIDYDVLSRPKRFTDRENNGYNILYLDFSPVEVRLPNNIVSLFNFDKIARLRKIQTLGLLEYNYEYDGTKLVSKSYGNRIDSLEYDENGNVSAAKEFGRSPINYNYSNDGNLNSILETGSSLISFEYSAPNKIKGIDIFGDKVDFLYSDGNYLPKEVDFQDIGSIKYIYDFYGNVTFEDRFGKFYTREYDEMGNLIEKNDGKVFFNTYDENNRLKSKLFPRTGNILEYEYDLNGNLTSIRDNNSNELNFKYNKNNQLIEKSLQSNGALQNNYQYDRLGNLISITSNAGESFSFSYLYGNLNQITRNSQPYIEFGFNNNSDITSLSNAFGTTYDIVRSSVGNNLNFLSPENTNFEINYQNYKLKSLNTANDNISIDYRLNLPFSYEINNQLVELFQVISFNRLSSNVRNISNESNILYEVSLTYNGIQPVRYTLNGFEFDVERDNLGNITKFIDFKRDTTILHYDENQLLELISKKGKSIRNRYDAFGNLFSTIDENDIITNYKINPRGILNESINQYSTIQISQNLMGKPDSITFNTNYHRLFYQNNSLQLTNGNNDRITLDFDTYGNLIRYSKDNTEKIFLRDFLGNVIRINTNNALFEDFNYNYHTIRPKLKSYQNQDIYGIFYESTDPYSMNISYSPDSEVQIRYNLDNKPITFTNELNQTYSYNYDFLSRLLEIQFSGRIFNFDYDDEGFAASLNDRPISQFKFDTYGRLIEKGLNSKKKFNYDEYGILEKVEQNSSLTQYDYSNLKLSSLESGNNTTQITYNKSVIKDYQPGNSRFNVNYKLNETLSGISNSKDVLIFSKQKTNNLYNITALDRDIDYEVNHLDKITNLSFGSQIYDFEYRLNGSLSRVFSNDDEISSVSYNFKNEAINIENLIDQNIFYNLKGDVLFYGINSIEFAFSYDNIGRLERIQHLANTTNITYTDTTYSFDDISFIYNSNSQIIKKESKFDDKIVSFDISFDTNHLPMEIRTNDLRVNYEYQNGSLNRIVAFNGDFVEIKFDSLGGIQSLHFPNNIELENTRNSLGNIITQTLFKNLDSAIDQKSYSYDQYNRISSILDLDNNLISYNFNDFNEIKEIYDQDELSNIFSYDENANLSSLIFNEQQILTRPLGNFKISNFGEFIFDYDTLENVKSIITSQTMQELEYNYLNKLSRYETDSVDISLNYYNNNELKTIAFDTVVYNLVAFPQFEDFEILSVYDDNIEPIQSYIAIKVKGETQGFLVYDHKNNVTSSIIYDLTQTTKYKINENGDLASKEIFDAFGNNLIDKTIVESDIVDLFGFMGKFKLPESNLYLIEGRVYSPEFYRFLQPEIELSKNHFNKYKYNDFSLFFQDIITSDLPIPIDYKENNTLFKHNYDFSHRIFDKKFANPLTARERYFDDFLAKMFNEYKTFPLIFDDKIREVAFPYSDIINHVMQTGRTSELTIHPYLPKELIDEQLVLSLNNDKYYRESFNSNKTSNLDDIIHLLSMVYGEDFPLLKQLKLLDEAINYEKQLPIEPMNHIYKIPIKKVSFTDIKKHTQNRNISDIIENNLKEKQRKSDFDKLTDPIFILEYLRNYDEFEIDYKFLDIPYGNFDYSQEPINEYPASVINPLGMINDLEKINSFNYFNILNTLRPKSLDTHKIGNLNYREDKIFDYQIPNLEIITNPINNNERNKPVNPSLFPININE